MGMFATDDEIYAVQKPDCIWVCGMTGAGQVFCKRWQDNQNLISTRWNLPLFDLCGKNDNCKYYCKREDIKSENIISTKP